MANKLILLGKSSGVQPIGFDEVLRRLIEEGLAEHCAQDFKERPGPIKDGAGHEAWAKPATHTMQQVWAEESTEGIWLMEVMLSVL